MAECARTSYGPHAAHPSRAIDVAGAVKGVAGRQPAEAAMIRTRKAHTDEMEQIATFYRANKYKPTIRPTDVIFIAENDDGKFHGAVRLCEENNSLVLRGMRVSERMQRQGIGTQLLETAELFIGDRECFCIPHRYLQSFYSRIGFIVIDESEAPAFLQARCAEYRDEFGLDVIIMYRPRGIGQWCGLGRIESR